jgi:biotin carboxyl carrier protein
VDSVKVNVNGKNYDIEVMGEKARVDGKEISIKPNEDEIIIDGNRYHLDFVEDGEPALMIINGLTYMVSKNVGRTILTKNVRAPISGRVIDVLVQVGSNVTEGQTLIILEAMKMENQIKSPVSAKISEVKVDKGQSVKTGEVLVTFE